MFTVTMNVKQNVPDTSVPVLIPGVTRGFEILFGTLIVVSDGDDPAVDGKV